MGIEQLKFVFPPTLLAIRRMAFDINEDRKK